VQGGGGGEQGPYFSRGIVMLAVDLILERVDLGPSNMGVCPAFDPPLTGECFTWSGSRLCPLRLGEGARGRGGAGFVVSRAAVAKACWLCRRESFRPFSKGRGRGRV